MASLKATHLNKSSWSPVVRHCHVSKVAMKNSEVKLDHPFTDEQMDEAKTITRHTGTVASVQDLKNSSIKQLLQSRPAEEEMNDLNKKAPVVRKAPPKPPRKNKPVVNIKKPVVVVNNLDKVSDEDNTTVWSETPVPTSTRCINQVITAAVDMAELLPSCEMPTLDCSITLMADAFKHNEQYANIWNGEESDHCQVRLDELSTICMLAEQTIREQYSLCETVDGPLHSTMKYPQSSTPTKHLNDTNKSSFIAGSDSLAKLIFDSHHTWSASVNSNTNSSPHVTQEAFSTSRDSDVTAFMKAPLCQKAVTYKVKSSRRAAVKRQLRSLGRQIRNIGAGKLNLQTLAVL